MYYLYHFFSVFHSKHGNCSRRMPIIIFTINFTKTFRRNDSVRCRLAFKPLKVLKKYWLSTTFSYFLYWSLNYLELWLTLFNIWLWFFSWEAKKRDVSDKLRDGEDLKKVKESDSISSLPHEVFSDGLNSPELAKLLANWLKSIENPVKELFTSHEEEKESLIKVNEPLEFMTAKFDDLERKSRKKMKRLLS